MYGRSSGGSRERVRAAIIAAFGAGYADADPLIRPSQFADFQANVALPLAKRLGMPPRQVAEQIVAQLDVAGVCDRVEVSGPGFINLTLASGLDRRPGIGPVPGRAARRARGGSGRNGRGRLFLAQRREGNARWAFAHDRCRGRHRADLEYLGNTVVRANHVGDWGTQFGLLIEHLLDVGEEAARAALSAGEINAFYQAARTKFDADPAFAERSRHRVVALQAGDPETLRLWQDLVTDSRQYYNAIYQRLGVTLTDADLAPESFYNPMLADVCAELERDGIAVISDGALVAFPPGFTGRDGSPQPIILRKRDGGYGYDTTDLAAIRYRIRDLKATRLIYVVGAEQSLHFRLVFAVARQAGWLTDEITAEHAVIGLVTGPDGGRIRTRTGESVKLITLIDEAIERAGRVIADRYDDPVQREQIAEAVGIGALKYGDLSVARDSGYTFDFDRMLALTGNTGPYLQYATARIRSIFRRAELDPAQAAGPIAVTEDAERALALTLLGFGPAVRLSADTAEPHHLAGFVFGVASAFTTFYEECPVLKAPDEQVRQSRLALCALALRVLTSGLDLLGVPVPDRM